LAAALHDVGGKAKVSELAEHDFIKAIASAKGRSVGIKLTLWGTLQHQTVDESGDSRFMSFIEDCGFSA